MANFAPYVEVKKKDVTPENVLNAVELASEIGGQNVSSFGRNISNVQKALQKEGYIWTAEDVAETKRRYIESSRDMMKRIENGDLSAGVSMVEQIMRPVYSDDRMDAYDVSALAITLSSKQSHGLTYPEVIAVRANLPESVHRERYMDMIHGSEKKNSGRRNLPFNGDFDDAQREVLPDELLL